MHLASGLHAKTCAEKLRISADWATAGAVVSSLFIITLITPAVGGLAQMSIVASKNAKRLEAASIIKNGGSESDLIKAQTIMGHFYESLVKRYPEMQMSTVEVVDWLEQLNSNKLGNLLCSQLKFGSLSDEFFPEAKRDEWLARHEEENERTERQAEATRIRQEKNRAANARSAPLAKASFSERS